MQVGGCSDHNPATYSATMLPGSSFGSEVVMSPNEWRCPSPASASPALAPAISGKTGAGARAWENKRLRPYKQWAPKTMNEDPGALGSDTA